MTVKNFVIVAMLFCCLAPVVSSAQQERRTPEERANRQTEWMKKNLSITPEQAIKVHDIVLVHARTVSGAPREDRRDLMRTEMSARDNELRGVLTADQYIRFQQHEDEMKQKIQDRRAMKQ